MEKINSQRLIQLKNLWHKKWRRFGIYICITDFPMEYISVYQGIMPIWRI